jgi:nitroreductase
LFEAARRAPSSMNEQPWRYWVGSDENPEFRERLRGLLVEGNSYAKAAPVLILSGASRLVERSGNPNRHAKHDLGAANLALMLEAKYLGLDSHPMGGFDYDEAEKITGEAVEPVAMIAVGYPGDPEALPEKLRERQANRRDRKPVEDFVRYEP